MIVFVLTLIDHFLKSIKNKLEIKGDTFLPSLIGAIGFMSFQYGLKLVANGKSNMMIVYCGIAVFIGSYFGHILASKNDKDSILEYILRFPTSIEALKVFHELRLMNIRSSYKEGSKKLIIDSKNKDVSRQIDKVIEGRYSSLKINKIERIERIERRI